ncbi:MAG: hypothetical protein ABIQ47_04245 [Tepidiformaceae bacterium]
MYSAGEWRLTAGARLGYIRGARWFDLAVGDERAPSGGRSRSPSVLDCWPAWCSSPRWLDICVFQQEGMDSDGKTIGRYRPTGLRPTFSQQLAQVGCELDSSLFLDGEWA